MTDPNKNESRPSRGEIDLRLPFHNFYSEELRPFAHENRRDMTKAEACLWKFALSRGQMKGYNFNRQRPVMGYIADFMCKKLNLIVEVDGISHARSGAYEKDVKRQHDLEQAGFTFIRFNDREVLQQIQGVKRMIYDKVVELEAKFGPSPSPPPAGDSLP